LANRVLVWLLERNLFILRRVHYFSILTTELKQHGGPSYGTQGSQRVPRESTGLGRVITKRNLDEKQGLAYSQPKIEVGIFLPY